MHRLQGSGNAGQPTSKHILLCTLYCYQGCLCFNFTSEITSFTTEHRASILSLYFFQHSPYSLSPSNAFTNQVNGPLRLYNLLDSVQKTGKVQLSRCEILQCACVCVFIPAFLWLLIIVQAHLLVKRAFHVHLLYPGGRFLPCFPEDRVVPSIRQLWAICMLLRLPIHCYQQCKSLVSNLKEENIEGEKEQGADTCPILPENIFLLFYVA